jgi:hypothetical protein
VETASNSITCPTCRSMPTATRRVNSSLRAEYMPFYRFQIESPLPAQTVLQRIRTLVRDKPGFWKSIKESFGGHPNGGPPFIGKVEGDTFCMYRDIRYRNSFLPQVRGSVVSTSRGSKVLVTMYLHPLVALFVLFWLGAVGAGALAVFSAQNGNIGPALIPAGMFLFGIILTVGAFYPEAFKARRLLEQSIGTEF